MKVFRNFEEIIDYAIDKEFGEIEFYSELADKMERKNVRQLFHSIALEKTARLLSLEKMKDLELKLETSEIPDLKITDILDDINSDKSDLSYQEALILAMKKVKSKFKFYIEMAERAINKECRDTFLALANDEARQKLKFEIEYDDYVLLEN